MSASAPLFRRIHLFILALIFALSASLAFAQEDKPAPDNTAIPPAAETTPAQPIEAKTAASANEFVNIVVNSRDNDTGRFSLTTVKGDPSRHNDDGRMLIYGENLPWTSFTTIRIDGTDYVFGGPTKRRAGKSAQFGKIIQPPTNIDGAVVTKCELGGVLVTQTLSIVHGPISGFVDTMKISYTIENTDSAQHSVGIRTVLDTLLGNNDGSPFKVGERSIQRETMMSGDQVPTYWIAYDSLDNPGVVSRGTLRGEGLTAPDAILFANWGKMADNPWNVPYTKGQSFIRAGEDELDSATALFWNETPVSPGGRRTVTTLYGIEYLNVSVDVLSIGTLRNLGKWPTAPNQIQPYTMYAYVKNTVDFDLTDVEISLKLPKGIKLSGDDNGVRNVGRLEAGKEVTIGWKIEPEPFSGDDKEHAISIVGTAKQVKEVSVKTNVTLLAAPDIRLNISAPEGLDIINKREYGPQNPFPIDVKCYNTGQSPIDNMKLSLKLSAGLMFPAAQKPDRAFVRLDGRDEVVFTWKVIATGEASGDLEYTIEATSDSTMPKNEKRTISVPPLPMRIAVEGVPETVTPGVFIPAQIFATNLRDFDSAEFSVLFDPSVADVIRVSQGTAFVEGLQATPWKEPVIDNKKGIVSGISGTRGGRGFNGNGSLAIIHFRAKGSGRTPVEIMGLKALDSKGQPLEFILDNAEIKVQQ